jgi:hypothetical protein
MCDYRTTPLPSAVTSNGVSIEVLCCVFGALSAREFRIVSLDHWSWSFWIVYLKLAVEI